MGTRILAICVVVGFFVGCDSTETPPAAEVGEKMCEMRVCGVSRRMRTFRESECESLRNGLVLHPNQRMCWQEEDRTVQFEDGSMMITSFGPE